MAKQKIPHTLFWFILYFLKPYLWHFWGIIFIAFLWAINGSLQPYVIKMMLDVLEKSGQGGTNLFSDLKIPLMIYIGVRLLTNVINRGHDYLALKFWPVFNKDILIRVTKYIQKHSHSYFQHQFGGSVVSKISIIADSLETIVDHLIYKLAFPFFTLGVVAFTMGTVHLSLAMILGLWAVVFIAISYRLSFSVQSLSEELAEKYTNLVGKLIDTITNIMAVRLFARRKHEIKALEFAAQDRVQTTKKLKWIDLKRNAILEFLANGLIGLLIYYLIIERQKGHISIGDFSLVFSLTLSMINIIWDTSRHYIRFVEAWGKCSQALKVIMAPHEIKDAPHAVPLMVKEGAIEFREVCFGFSGKQPLFKNFSLILQPGEKIGVVGQSGSGKTTFLNLIVRLWDVNSGSILIDQQDIKDVTQDSLHQNISFIPQDPLLFHRTILENIKYGKLDASEEEVRDAVHNAHADGFINALPEGYHTLVGERGTTLSGGQRQRLAIARAILKNAKVLILDEATSALDSETEHYIQGSLDLLMQNKTVLVAAHRLSTLLKMDRILVFQEGGIIEEGSHKTLLQKRGVYAKFWDMQADHTFE